MVGVAGPFFDDHIPYITWVTAFSTFEPIESKTPLEHVRLVHNAFMKKGRISEE